MAEISERAGVLLSVMAVSDSHMKRLECHRELTAYIAALESDNAHLRRELATQRALYVDTAESYAKALGDLRECESRWRIFAR